MDAVTYGTIPSAKSDSRDSDEPERRLSSPKIVLPFEWRKFPTAVVSTPGAGSQEPKRYTARTPAVKSRRRRSSGTFATFVSHDSTTRSSFRSRGSQGATPVRRGSHRRDASDTTPA